MGSAAGPLLRRRVDVGRVPRWCIHRQRGLLDHVVDLCTVDSDRLCAAASHSWCVLNCFLFASVGCSVRGCFVAFILFLVNDRYCFPHCIVSQSSCTDAVFHMCASRIFEVAFGASDHHRDCGAHMHGSLCSIHSLIASNCYAALFVQLKLRVGCNLNLRGLKCRSSTATRLFHFRVLSC